MKQLAILFTTASAFAHTGHFDQPAVAHLGSDDAPFSSEAVFLCSIPKLPWNPTLGIAHINDFRGTTKEWDFSLGLGATL